MSYQDTRWGGVLPLCREAVGVFYSPRQLGEEKKERKKKERKKEKRKKEKVTKMIEKKMNELERKNLGIFKTKSRIQERK